MVNKIITSLICKETWLLNYAWTLKQERSDVYHGNPDHKLAWYRIKAKLR